MALHVHSSFSAPVMKWTKTETLLRTSFLAEFAMEFPGIWANFILSQIKKKNGSDSFLSPFAIENRKKTKLMLKECCE